MTRSTTYRLLSIAAMAGMAGCGKMGDLEPAKGHPLPVKPLMARATPTPQQLLTVPAYADPNRVDELMKKSAPRQADPFDLPPPNGQAPKIAPEGATATNQAGPVTPQ